MSSVFLSNMLRRWLKVFMWSRSSCWKLACLVSGLGVNRGGSLLTVLLGAPSVERVVRLAESRVLVKTTAVPTVVVHLRPSPPPPPPPSTSSSSSSPLPPPPTSFSQLKLNTASAPHPSGSSSSREGSPQLSEDGRASLKVRTTESGMWVNHHLPRLIFAQQRSIGQTDVLINVYIYVLKTQEALTGDTSNRPWQQSRSRKPTTNKRKGRF